MLLNSSSNLSKAFFKKKKTFRLSWNNQQTRKHLPHWIFDNFLSNKLLHLIHLGHKIGWIHSGSSWVDPAELSFIVVDKFNGLSLQVPKGSRFREGGHLERGVLLVGKVEALELHRLRVHDHGAEVGVDVEGGALVRRVGNVRRKRGVFGRAGGGRWRVGSGGRRGRGGGARRAVAVCTGVLVGGLDALVDRRRTGVFFLFFRLVYGQLALPEELQLGLFHLGPQAFVLDQDLALEPVRRG